MMELFLAIAGFGKSAFSVAGKWLSRRSLGEIVGIALAAALAIDHLSLLAAHRHGAKVERQLQASTQALANARVDEYGLKKAIADQNAAIASLSGTSAEQQNVAAKALQTAAQRAAEAQATSDRLKASSRVAPLKSAPACEPSAALKEQWQ